MTNVLEVSEKLPKIAPETSDSRDYKRLQRFLASVFNRCNLFNNRCNQRAPLMFRLFQSSLLALLVVIFFLKGPCFASPLFETERFTPLETIGRQQKAMVSLTGFTLSMESYLRKDFISFKNVVDLDSRNSDDTTTYLGIDYSLGFRSEFKDRGSTLFLKLERNGPYDYSAPLFVHNTLINSGGVIEEYRNDELLPNLEEFWLDTPLLNNFRIKAGLYTYEVGNGFSLNGAYENYGFMIYKELEDFSWHLYYCRPDLVYKNHLGSRIRQDEEQGIDYEHNAANFFATDFKFELEKNSLQPYIGVLADYTSFGKRDNSFTAPIKRDILGTIGLAWDRDYNNLSFTLEVAHNFGKAKSNDPAYKDVYHVGYLFYTGLDYRIDKFIPFFGFLLSSGNKVTEEAVENQDETLTSGKNRAFSYSSPLNKNLGDSISSSNVDMLPIVAMGGGYGLNYGLPRPETFWSGDFENLIMPSLGFDFNLTEKLCISLYGYYLRAFERGLGLLNEEARYLSKDLGYELDLFIDYKLNKNTLISILGGYFLPGRFYKEERDDTEGSLFSPFVRGDGNVDTAYQIELAVEFRF